MKTTIPIHIDMADLARIRERMSEVDLPKLEGVGKTADETIDRLLGRTTRTPSLPWLATGFGLVAIVGLITAAFLWLRRPSIDTSKATPPPIDPIDTPSRVDLTPDLDTPIGGSRAFDGGEVA